MISASPRLLDYPWPEVPDHPGAPVWDGARFHLGTNEASLLSYQPSQSGWSDDLTVFHEETAGSDHPIDRASREMALAGLSTVASPAPLVLEIGCSSGYMLMLARQRVPDAQWIGSDYVRGPLESLARDLPGVPLLHFDLRECPLPDNSLDAVLLLNVLEHIDDDARAMHQVQRVLRPGGVAVIEVPAGPQLYDVYDELLMHFRRYTAGGLSQLIRGSGLAVERMTHLGVFIYPAFYLVKKRNQRFLSREQAIQRQIVATEIRSTRSNQLLRTLLEMELAIGRHVQWPVGIRCCAVARKSS